MPQTTQGQGTTPWEGANILGAGIAGYETPTGTGLTPEAEHMFRAVYAKELASISRLKMELATQSVTSYANIAVALQNAKTNALNALVNMARIQGMDNQRVTTGLLAIEELSGSMAMSAGLNYEEKSATIIRGAGQQLLDHQLATGPVNSIKATLSNILNTPGVTSQQIGNALVKLIGDKNRTFGRNVAGTIERLRQDGAHITTIVDTKDLAKRQLTKATDDAFQEAIDQLSVLPGGMEHVQYLIVPKNMNTYKAHSIASRHTGIQKSDRESIFVDPIEERAAKRARLEGSQKQEALRRTFQAMGVGIPREISDAFFEMADMSKSIVEDGPEAFAKSLVDMPTPISVQITEQKLAYQLDQLDNPTDRLSQAVAKYASRIPYFANYMAAMGMDEPFDAVEYLMAHPSDRQEYFKIVKYLAGDEGNIDELNNPEALQERLRVAGSSDQDSIFRTSFLTKPIERLFGVGFNRPEAWRHFSGRNSQEQLENAIATLHEVGEEEFSRAVQDKIDKEPTGHETGVSLEETEATAGGMSNLDSWVVETDANGQATKMAVELPNGLVGVYSTSDYSSPDTAVQDYGRPTQEQSIPGGVAFSYGDEADAHRAKKVVEDVASIARGDEDEPRDPSYLKSSAKDWSTRKREKVQTAAEKYLKRINPDYVRPGEAEESGRFMLKGLEGPPVIEEEPPPPPTPTAPPKEKKTYPRIGAGGDPDRYGKELDFVQAEAKAEKVARIEAKREEARKAAALNAEQRQMDKDAADKASAEAQAKLDKSRAAFKALTEGTP